MALHSKHGIKLLTLPKEKDRHNSFQASRAIFQDTTICFRVNSSTRQLQHSTVPHRKD
jgi:hypothetical protein